MSTNSNSETTSVEVTTLTSAITSGAVFLIEVLFSKLYVPRIPRVFLRLLSNLEDIPQVPSEAFVVQKLTLRA